MTQQEKQLLLKDLCGRLPYLENWVRYDGKDYIVTGHGNGRVSLLPSMFSSAVGPCPWIEEVKPYLRPMSSISKDEIDELNKTFGNIGYFFTQEEPYYYGLQVQHDSIGSIIISDMPAVFDWLNAHHFDYRCLIEKGLALEAPEDMYK